jgi:hypothetical protein
MTGAENGSKKRRDDMELCGECKYYRSKASPTEGLSNYSGYCRRYPRIPLGNAKFYIPEVDDDDFCGEWIQKMEE